MHKGTETVVRLKHSGNDKESEQIGAQRMHAESCRNQNYMGGR